MREMLGLGPSRWGWEGPREGRRRAVRGLHHTGHTCSSSVLSSCCWGGQTFPISTCSLWAVL